MAATGKSHRQAKAGRKAEKKKQKKAPTDEAGGEGKKGEGKKEQTLEQKRQANPRAFAFQSAGKAKAQRARSAEKEQRRLHGEGRESCCCMRVNLHAQTAVTVRACMRALRVVPSSSAACKAPMRNHEGALLARPPAVPIIERGAAEDPPPLVVLVHGPPQVRAALAAGEVCACVL